jgi:hypothetical protein
MQMKCKRALSVLTDILIFVAMVSIAQAQDKKIDVKDLPKAVSAAFQKTYPKATIVGTAMEVENGKTMYEVESKDGGVNRDLLYTDKGEVFEIEESVTSESLPADMKVTLEKQFTKFKLVKGEKVTQGAKVEYDLQVKSAQKRYNVVLDNNARIVKSDVVKVKKDKKENKEKGEKEEKDEK